MIDTLQRINALHIFDKLTQITVRREGFVWYPCSAVTQRFVPINKNKNYA